MKGGRGGGKGKGGRDESFLTCCMLRIKRTVRVEVGNIPIVIVTKLSKLTAWSSCARLS